jgi:cyclophilin family peptidyl-prolyl cis-trans isomerase
MKLIKYLLILKKKTCRGTCAAAQHPARHFPIALPNDSSSWATLKGKYVVFGEVIEDTDVLDRLDSVGSSNGVSMEKVWIGGCGVLE